MAPRIVILVGPTASGKTSLSIELAKRFDGEIVSADSRQVYTGLDIGTGKVTSAEMQGVPHHLLDVASPDHPFSAGEYQALARQAIEDIARRGRLPIVCGGTGFYVDALVGRIAVPDVPPDAGLRTRLSEMTTEELFARLSAMDPRRAEAMSSASERSNRVRLIRAIEITTHIGSVPPHTEVGSPYDVCWIGIKPDDETLRTNINARLSARIQGDMVAEAEHLHARGLSFARMEELGLEYRSLARHLQGLVDLEEMERELQSDIWRYARKQIGYWKRNKEIHWFAPNETERIAQTVAEWLAR